MAGVSAGRLSIEIVAEVARLQQDMDRVKRLVGAASSDIARNARVANDNLANIGKGASTNVVQFSREVARLKGELDPTWAALQKYKSEVFLLSQAYRQGAISQDQYTRELVRVRTGWQQSGATVVASTGAQKAGLQQLMMNLGDMTTMYSLGAKTSQIFASQIGQLIQSIQLMSMGAGKFATFMSNPWVVAITMATLVLAPLIANLFSAKKATEEVKLSANGLSDAQSTLGQMFDLSTGKIKSNTEALRANNQLLAINLRIEALKAKDDADAAFKKAGQKAFSVSDSMTADLPAYGNFAPTKAEKNTQTLINLMDDLKTGAINYTEAIKKANKADFTGTNTTKIEFLQGLADGLTAVSKNETAAAVEATNATGKLDKSLMQYTKDHKSAAETRAENLARESRATDAMIAGLYTLAEAYLQGDAAAKEAEITAKATEQGMKKQADVAAYVAQQKRLYAAQETADAAKNFAAMRDENDQRQILNNQVKQGLITSEKAAQIMRDEAALRPYLAAQAGAEGQAKAKLTEIIAKLRNEQQRSNDEALREQDLSQSQKMGRDLAGLKDEIALNERLGKARIDALSTVGGEPLEDALARINHEREIETIRLKANAEAADYTRLGMTESAKATLAVAEANIKLSDSQFDFDQQATGIDRVNKHIAEMLDLLDSAADRTDRAAQGMADAFGNVGDAIGKLSAQFAQYAVDQARLAEELRQAEFDKDYKKASDIKIAQQELQLTNYRQLAGTAKTFFKEGSAGYKAMGAAEKAFALIQLANTATNIAAGAAKMFASLGPWAFPVVAAMVAVMAGLGFSGGSGVKGTVPQSADDVQAAQGAGTVLGDPTAKSDSIARALDLTADNTNQMLEYDNAMLRSLRSIDTNIGALATQVAKELSIGGAFDTTGKVGTSGSSGFLGLFGSTTTKSLYDQGVNFASTTLADAIANGISGSTYQIIEKVKTSNGFLGLGGGTKTSYTTTTGALDPDLERQVGLILGSLHDSVIEAAKILGIDVGSALDTFKVEIGKISFKDMSTDEISAALEAVFSKVADQMAGFAVSGLEQFQQAGEGLFETLTRLAKDYTTIDTSLRSIGLTFGAVGASSIAARESLIALFGTLDDFVDATAFYQQNFLTDAQQLAPIKAQVQSTLKDLGLSNVDTIAEFKQVVDGIDLTTEAGQALYKKMMDLAPAFYAVEQAQEKAAQQAADLAKQKAQLDIDLLTAQGDAEGALAAKRQQELAAADASLRDEMTKIYKAQDIATAKDALSEAYKRESDTIQGTIDSLKSLRDNLVDVRASIYATSDGASDYAATLAELRRVGALAGMGDQDAASKLGGAISNFLPAAKAHARTLADYQMAQAMAAQYADSAISAADQGILVAQEQLDQLKTAVGALIDLNETELSVADAMQRLIALQGGDPEDASGTAGSGGLSDVKDGLDRLHDVFAGLRDEFNSRWERMEASQVQSTLGINAVAKFFRIAGKNGDRMRVSIVEDETVGDEAP